LRPNGSMFWAVTTIDPLLLRDGRLQGFAHVIRASAVSAEVSAGPPTVQARRTSRTKTSPKTAPRSSPKASPKASQ
jgi:hypothetical protein